MKAFAIIIALLIAPFFLYFYMHQEKVAIFVGLWMIFTIPSIVEITIMSIKDRKWPVIVGGPSVSYGKWIIDKRGITKVKKIDPDAAQEALLELCRQLEKMPRRLIKDSQTYPYIGYDNVDALIEQARNRIGVEHHVVGMEEHKKLRGY